MTTGAAADLLASLMSAMAMRILLRRKMRSRMITTSTMHRMITGEEEELWAMLVTRATSIVPNAPQGMSSTMEKQHGWDAQSFPKQNSLPMTTRRPRRPQNVPRGGGWTLTEGQPGLAQVQVDAKVGLEAQVRQGHIGTRFSFQFGVFQVTVEDSCGERRKTATLAPRSHHRDVAEDP